MKLSVIMPTYNEERTLRIIVKRVFDVPLDIELIVVDDCSHDKTRDILNELSKKYNIKTIYQKTNRGKGAAIRAGIKYATGDMVVIQDADLEYDPQDYLLMIKPVLDKKSEVVYGSRFLDKKIYKNQKKMFYLGNMFLTVLSNILYGTSITDEATCYKLFSTKALRKVKLCCNRFEFCPEITAKVSKLGYRIVEVPISYHPRDIKEGKKIRLSDGLDAAWTLVKYRFIK